MSLTAKLDADIMQFQQKQLYCVAQQLRALRNEVNCRREHGASGAEHLKYVEDKLTEILDIEPIAPF